jgi:hypothetical protein
MGILLNILSLASVGLMESPTTPGFGGREWKT